MEGEGGHGIHVRGIVLQQAMAPRVPDLNGMICTTCREGGAIRVELNVKHSSANGCRVTMDKVQITYAETHETS